VHGQRLHHPGGDVAGQADLQGYLVLAQPVQQPRVLRRGDAVADAFGPELVDGRPYLLRTSTLSGMRHTVQPGGAGGGEPGAEAGPPHPGLPAAETEAGQRGRRVLQRRV
jgi:hypothetical protein